MVDLRYGGGIGTLLEGMGVGLGQLEVVQTANGPMVLGVSGRDGGVICVGFNGAGDPQILEQRFFENSVLNAADGRLAVVQAGGDTVVLVGAQGANTLVGYQMNTGGLGGAVTLEGTGAAGARGTQTSQTDNGFIFSAAFDGSLRCFRADQNGNLQSGEVVWDTANTFHGQPTALESVSVAGQSYLLSLSSDDAGVSVFAVDDATGRLSETASLGTSLGLGLYETPNDLVTVDIGGSTYVIVSSRGETTQGAALSVMELTANGELMITDHIIDNLATRFGTVSGISVVEHEGFQYLLAAGADQGIDLFTLMPNGRLVLLDTITTQVGASLDSLTDIAAVVVGDQLNVLATSHLEDQITALSADLSAQGQMLQTGDSGGTLQGGARNDMLVGGRGADTLMGGAGDDIIYDGTGADVMTGGDGADRFIIAFDSARDIITDYRHREDTIDLSHIPMLYSMAQVTVTSYSWGAMLSFRGQELEVQSRGGLLSLEDIERSTIWTVDRPPLVVQNEVRGGGSADTLEGSDASDVILGEGGSDVIYAGLGNDLIDGGAANDTIFAGEGSDTVEGGAGADVVNLGAGNDVYVDNGASGGLQNDTVFGGDGDDTITSILGNDELHGGAGNDSLTGGVGNDRIYGGTSFDWIAAGAGNDQVWGGDGRDTAFLGAGNDVFFDNGQGGEFGRDTVFAGAGDDTIQGGNGNDVFIGEDGNDVIYARLGDDSVYGGNNDDVIHAGDGRDVVFGGNGRDLVYLNQGNDLFVDNGQGGDAGRDTVFAGFGNDTIEGGNGDDTFFGEWGNDLIHARLGNDSVYAGDGDDSVYAGDGRDLAFLGGGNDIFYDTAQGGVQGRDTVYAGAGNDTIEGGNGDDLFYGQDGNDLILARLGNDTVYAGAGFDIIDTGDGNDVVFAGEGRDRVFLGQGDDRYVDTAQNGELGQDTINGGPGADTFVFGPDMSRDVITDFQTDIDTLAFDRALTEGRSSWGVMFDLARVTDDGVLIDFGDGQSLLLENLTSLSGLAGDIDVFSSG